jgi:hypothetical protein
VKKFFLSLIICFFIFSLYGQISPDDKECAKVNTLINKAQSKLGIKYVWGATGPENYDCSGFTQAVFKEINIELPRTAREQFQCNAGQRVAFKNIRKGDLVFFIAQELDRVVGHVGIAITDCSDKRFSYINASSSKGEICIGEFNDKMFSGSYAGAKRLIMCAGVASQNNVDNTGSDSSDEAVKFKDFPEEFFYHDVISGETLLSIAMKYFVQEQDIILWNDLKTSSLEGVKQLKIYPSVF